MFKSIGQTLSGHKQMVIAAIAVSGMLLAFPAQQLASAQVDIRNPQDLAQDIVQDTEQSIDQDQDQDQDLDQEATNELDQSNEANIDQSEENNQANVIETGDNTASTTQTADENIVSASGGDAGADSWAKAHKGDAKASSDAEGGDAEAAVENEATTIQDSSADHNVLVNENTFGDDVALVDQDNTADQTAVNVGLQEQDQDQDATNLDFDFASQYGIQCRADLSIQSAAFC